MIFDENNVSVDQEKNQSSETDQKNTEADLALQTCRVELNEWRERCLRTTAEFENHKKRIEKDRSMWIANTQEQMLRAIVEIVDNFDRAFVSLQEKEQDEQTKQWLTGFTLTYQEFAKLLAKYGVEEMKEYTTFDPHVHEAILQVSSPSHKPGDIVQVLQKGYRFKGAVLRVAKVSVAI